MPDTPDMRPPEPASLRLLRILVTALMAVMIAGVIAVVALLVTRWPQSARVPSELAVPDGVTVHAVTQAPGFWIVTTADGRAFVFAPDGALRGEMALRDP